MCVYTLTHTHEHNINLGLLIVSVPFNQSKERVNAYKRMERTEHGEIITTTVRYWGNFGKPEYLMGLDDKDNDKHFIRYNYDFLSNTMRK